MDGILQLASTEGASFFDETFLYIAGGLLVVFSLVGAFVGMRQEGFPTDKQFKVLTPIAVVLVVCTAIGAVQSARFEQAHRRAENQEAAKEAQEAEATKEAEEAPLTEGEAAEPGTATGEASSPQEEPGGGAGELDGKAIFTETGCGDCHVLADAGSEGQIGPALDDALAGMSPEEIRTSIIDPGATVSEGFPAGVMPSDYSSVLSEAELDTLVAYLSEVTSN